MRAGIEGLLVVARVFTQCSPQSRKIASELYGTPCSPDRERFYTGAFLFFRLPLNPQAIKLIGTGLVGDLSRVEREVKALAFIHCVYIHGELNRVGCSKAAKHAVNQVRYAVLESFAVAAQKPFL